MTRLMLLWLLAGGLSGCMTPPKLPDCDGPYTPINSVTANGSHDARSDD